MIADTERLVDGFRGVPAGVDGSKDPPLVPEDAVYYATNVTFRGGNGPRTRPGFREISPTYWRDPQPKRTISIAFSYGIATCTTAAGAHGYEDGDKVIIFVAAGSPFNKAHTIKVTGSNTFTFQLAVRGFVNYSNVSAIRDIDATYGEDLVDGKTSRGRVAGMIGATLIQGVVVYQDPREGNPSQMIVVGDGLIYALNFDSRSCFILNATDPVSSDLPVYLTQAEKFLIIQTGQDEPRVYDGYVLRRASYYGSPGIPVGKQMAYGQGRLFVAVNSGSEIVAGDLVFGGSLTESRIITASASNPTVITTASPHGLTSGDLVSTIGNSSVIDSTYVATTISATSFTIPVNVSTAGSGGTAVKFNAGQDSDLLSFTENTFLNEGGSFSPTGKIGRVTGMVFLPVQDTTTGQGDLIAFCERGAATFQVSAPRDQWKNTQGFQRVLYDNIGSTSDSIIPINGDLFFRSREGNGIRTYRNARAEADGYGQTPISAELDPLLRQDTQWMLDRVSLVNFDNRLLMTCLPKQYPRRATNEAQAEEFAAEPIPTLYDGIAVLDFNSVSVGRGKKAAVFDGVWTGLRIHKLVQGTFDNDPRCFALCLHEDSTGRRNEIWEITKNDEYDTPTEGPRLVNAAIVSRAYDFKDSMSLKKLLRCDLWFDDIGGGPENSFICSLAYRPDDYPNFTTWQSFQRNFVTQFTLEEKNLLYYTEAIDNDEWLKDGATVSIDQIANPVGQLVNADKLIENADDSEHLVRSKYSQRRVTGLADYTFSVFIKAAERNRVYLNMMGIPDIINSEAWFDVSGFSGSTSNVSAGTTATITALENGWFRCSITAKTTNSGSIACVIGLASTAESISYQGNGSNGLYVWGAQLEQSDRPTAYEADPGQLVNYARGYAPQVRFPTPPRTTNLATDVPAYLGHDFTLRVEWAGHARLGRLMLHGSRLTEAVNGGSL